MTNRSHSQGIASPDLWRGRPGRNDLLSLDDRGQPVVTAFANRSFGSRPTQGDVGTWSRQSPRPAPI